MCNLLTTVYHYGQRPDGVLPHVVIGLAKIVEKSFYCRSIMKCSFEDNHCCSLMNTEAGAIEKLVQCGQLQRVLDILSDILRFAFGRWDNSSITVVNEHASHKTNDYESRDSKAEEK